MRRGDEVVLRVADDGCGLPGGFILPDSEGLGLQLVRGLVQSDLHGSLRLFETQGNPDLPPVDQAVSPAPEAQTARTGGDSGESATETIPESGSHELSPRRWTVVELAFQAMLPEETNGAATTPAVEG
jgi:hypothetical protein